MTDPEGLTADSIVRMRRRCLEDPIYLGAEILGYDYLKKPCRFHLDIAWWMRPRFECKSCLVGWVGARDCPLCGAGWRSFRDQESRIRRMPSYFEALGPRGHIKTTLKSIVGDIYENLLDADVRILIAQANLQNARKVLSEITGHYVGNPVFRAVWPEYAPEIRDEMPNAYEFTCPNRRSPAKEPTFTCIGQDGAVTGQHFEIIDFDDVVYRENVPPAATPEQMERTWEWIQTFPMLLDQTLSWAHCRGSGTRWHDGDANGRVLSESGYEHYRRIVYSCYDADGNPIWPEQFSKEKLERIRGEVGEYWFAANYLNDPMPADGTSLFKDQHFLDYDRAVTLREKKLVKAITVDLAISDASKVKSDRTAIVVSGVDHESALFVLQACAGRWTPYEVIDRLYLLDAVWQPDWIGIESVAFQKMMIYTLHEEGRRRGKTLPVRVLMPDGSKVRRASMLSVIAQARGIHVLRNDPDQQQMMHECLRMTLQGSVGKHDDYVDALSYRAQYMVRAESPEIPVVKRASIVVKSEITGADLLEWAEEQEMLAEAGYTPGSALTPV